MPACFSLTRKDNGRVQELSSVDDDMRKHFGVKPDPEKWYNCWYGYIGLKLATGTTFDEMLLSDMEEADKEIVVWLKENYTANSWYER